MPSSELCSGLLSEGSLVISVNSFFNRTPSYEFIQAIEDTCVQFITYEELESLYRDFPEFNIIGRKLITAYYIASKDRNYLLRLSQDSSIFSLEIILVF